MKKTIVALAAATSVALTQGVAVAETSSVEPTGSATAVTTSVEAPEETTTGSADKTTETDTKGEEGKGDDEQPSASSSSNFFGWNETTTGWEKFQDIATMVAGIVALTGSIASLIANINKVIDELNIQPPKLPF